MEIVIPWHLYYRLVLGRYCGDTVPGDTLTHKSTVIVTYTAAPGVSNQTYVGFSASVSLAPAGKKALGKEVVVQSKG